MELYSRGDAEVSRLNPEDRLMRYLEKNIKVYEKYLDMIDPDNNSLPADGFHGLVMLNQDAKDYLKHLGDYNAYDPG